MHVDKQNSITIYFGGSCPGIYHLSTFNCLKLYVLYVL